MVPHYFFASYPFYMYSPDAANPSHPTARATPRRTGYTPSGTQKYACNPELLTCRYQIFNSLSSNKSGSWGWRGADYLHSLPVLKLNNCFVPGYFFVIRLPEEDCFL